MQVHYGEGVAIRIGPEPCAVTREGGGEASVGEHSGPPISAVGHGPLRDRPNGPLAVGRFSDRLLIPSQARDRIVLEIPLPLIVSLWR